MTQERDYLLARLGLPTSQLSNTDLENLLWQSGAASPGGPSDASIAALLQNPESATGAAVAATYAPLAQLAASPDLLAVGTITRSGTGAATAFAVAWPDGATGTFTGTESTSTPGAIDSYTVTHVKSGTTTITYTQPALTRNASGAVISRPAITAA